MGKLLNRKGLLVSLIMILILVSFIFSQIILASDQLPQRNQNHYVDGENLLSDETKNIIKSVNQDLIASDKGEIVVVTTDSFKPFSDAKEYSLKLFEKWKIGSKENDDGLLILFSSKEKKSRIEVGYGLEGLLPDGKTGRFQDEYAIPHFENGDYDTGIRNLFLNFAYEMSPSVKEKYKGKEVAATESSKSTSNEDDSSDVGFLKSLLILLVFLAFMVAIGLPLLIIRFVFLLIVIPIYRLFDKKTGNIALLKYQYSFKSESIIDRIVGKFISKNKVRSDYYSNHMMSTTVVRGERSFWSAIFFVFAIMSRFGGGDSSSGSGGSGGYSGGGSSGGGGSDRSW